MKVILPLVLALLFIPLQSYADSDPHDLHKQLLSGSSNKIFTPFGKAKQQALSKVNPIGDTGHDIKRIKRVNWVEVNTAAIDALRSYAVEVLGQADNNSAFDTWERKDFEGDNIHVRIKQPIDFPLDINLNFFDNIQFNDLFLSKVTKTTTMDGKVNYTLTLDQRNTSLPAIYIMLKDKLTIYTNIVGSYIRLEQVNEANFRIYQQKKPVNAEGQVNPAIKKADEEPTRFVEPLSAMNNVSVLPSSTPRFIDILVLFDNHTNQSYGKTLTVLPGLTQINKVLVNSNINAQFGIIAYDKLPSPICGGGVSPCYSSYESHLAEIKASKAIWLKLKPAKTF